MADSKTRSSGAKSHLIVSDEVQPSIALKPGMKFAVHAITVVDTGLRPVRKIAARLCGGTTTCLALTEIGKDFDPV